MGKRAVLPRWCKEAKVAMIEKDLCVNDIAEKTGKSRTWVSGILNGRSYSPKAVKEISYLLNISDTYPGDDDGTSS